MLDRIFISIGSNMGDRAANLKEAIRALSALSAVSLVTCSSVYSSPPWGVTDQGDFLNTAVEVSSTLSPDDLLKALKGIETSMGRVPAMRWGERIIDLDIIFYGDRIISERDLIIPHSHALDRDFVLIPISEIAPDFIFPGIESSISTLARETGDGKVKRLREVSRRSSSLSLGGAPQ